jgi:hypothetical protein
MTAQPQGALKRVLACSALLAVDITQLLLQVPHAAGCSPAFVFVVLALLLCALHAVLLLSLVHGPAHRHQQQQSTCMLSCAQKPP